jgi:hypothetical protein
MLLYLNTNGLERRRRRRSLPSLPERMRYRQWNLLMWPFSPLFDEDVMPQWSHCLEKDHQE